MSETKHTSGPFDLSMGAGGSGGLFVRDAKRRLIAGFQTTSLSDEMLPEEGEANAQLFIAAGDMADALKAFSLFSAMIGKDGRPSWFTDDGAWTEFVIADELRIAAIAKAGTQ